MRKKKKSKAEVAYKKSFSLLNQEHYPRGPKISHLLTGDGELAEKAIPVVCVCERSTETLPEAEIDSLE